MEYKQYSAEEGKVLLNLDTASWCSNCYCSITKSVDVINVLREDGVYFNGKYNSSLQEAESEEDIAKVKNMFHEEIILKGYDISKLVEPIIVYK